MVAAATAAAAAANNNNKVTSSNSLDKQQISPDVKNPQLISDLTINKLKKDNILSHAKFIYILYNEARTEYWVHEEI